MKNAGILLGALAIAFAGSLTTSGLLRIQACAPGDISPLRIDPGEHWQALGAVTLVPPIHLPTRPGGRSRTTVRLAIPAGGVIDVDTRGLLTFPPGTVADRVEEVRTRDGWAVADVRGQTLDEGSGRFHLLRPGADGLTGYSWPASDGHADRWVHDTLAAELEADPTPMGASPSTSPHADVAAGLRARGDCARCHQPAAAVDLAPAAIVHRGTDAVGWYVPMSVLDDEAPLEDYRPDDANDSPFVAVRCDDGEPERVTLRGGRRWRCPGGEAPIARLDIAGALAAGDTHARAVCASRRWLQARMTPRALARFEAALRPCRPTGQER